MSDRSLLSRTSSDTGLLSRRRRKLGKSSTCIAGACAKPAAKTLSSLPYDILLAVAKYLEPDDILSLKLTCRHLRDFSRSRAIWLTMAIDMLELSRPLPLHGFRNVMELDTSDLAKAVRWGRRVHRNWTTEGVNPSLNPLLASIEAPSHEDIVWISSITSRFLLCCARSGNVLCWDISQGSCVASWFCGSDCEIWKCRVEHEERTVYFAIAKRAADRASTNCQLVSLKFPDDSDPHQEMPDLIRLKSFSFPGRVISVYLLDPLRRLLSAYIWLEATNQLGLYLLLDWSKSLYVFINTGIHFDHQPRELSCIGYDPEHVVIHAEEETRVTQYFYPYSFLRAYTTSTPPSALDPPLVRPMQTTEVPFLHTENPFSGKYITQSAHFVRQWWPLLPDTQRLTRRSCTTFLQAMSVPHPSPEDPAPGPDDPPPGTHLFTIAQHYFSVPLANEKPRWWYMSEPVEIVCYPQLLEFDALTFPMEEVILPFDIPLNLPNVFEAALLDAEDGVPFDFQGAPWNVEQAAAGPHAAEVMQAGGAEFDPDLGAHIALQQLAAHGRAFPLVAVDFGRAVWLEYKSFNSNEMRLRYINFPPVDVDRSKEGFSGLSSPGDIHTLEVPPELDLKMVCHIGLDQAQGTITLGMRSSTVHVLRYS